MRKEKRNNIFNNWYANKSEKYLKMASVCLFNDMSTFMGYLMAKLSLQENIIDDI